MSAEFDNVESKLYMAWLEAEKRAEASWKEIVKSAPSISDAALDKYEQLRKQAGCQLQAYRRYKKI